ncbi:arylsulfatase B-like [Amphiura filiformis]|uniref:arylsulfatase B-like n=1 Tax=Amphiura filiformis TaxID=82378 RepID=UPI003B2211AB
MKGVAGVLLVMVTLAYVDANHLKGTLEKISRAEEVVEILKDLEGEDRADDDGLAKLADDLEEKEEETLEKMVLEALEEKEEEKLEKMLLEALKEQEDNNDLLQDAITRNNDKPPHIILILADDLGYNDVGYTATGGSAFETKPTFTPNIDDLAADGVKLGKYYVQPQCSPTRSQLLTGRYQIRTGLHHNVIDESRPFCLPLAEVTMADKLREAGYKTHLVGKWHLGFYAPECTPTYRGFDSFLGFYGEAIEYYSHDHTYTYVNDNVNPPVNINITACDFRDGTSVACGANYDGEYKDQYATDIYTKTATDIITSHATDNPNTPMFLFVSMQSPHAPLEVPQRYRKNFKDIITDENMKNRKIVAGMISSLDESVGLIVDSLKDNGLYDNSVIVFSSDNGAPTRYGNNWPLRGGKNSLFEGGIRAVGFVNSPLLPAAVKSTTSNALIHVSDWFPTFVNLAEGNLNGLAGDLDGFDAWNVIENPDFDWNRTEILHNIDPKTLLRGVTTDNSIFDTSIQAAFRKGSWKILTGNPGK